MKIRLSPFEEKDYKSPNDELPLLMPLYLDLTKNSKIYSDSIITNRTKL
jgi:hypothetical protein